MTFQWLGAALVMLTATLCCVSYRQKAMRREMLLRTWCLLLRYAREQIACFGTPLNQILQQRMGDVEIIMGECPSPLPTFEQLCRSSSTDMPPAAVQLLGALGAEIGTLWRQEQLARLDDYIGALEKEKSTYTASLAGKFRLHNTLCLCGGLGMLLLLW